MPAESSAASEIERALSTFATVRPRLFGIAYRMLGSASEAQDIVQEVWIRWQTYDRSTVRDPAAFLATTTTRLAINAVTSARVRRETYIGPWLPEPVDTSADPLLGAERGEALEFAVLLILEKLSPTERAAYVLREAFDYPYSQIAEVIQQTEASSRQLVSRARKHLAEERRASVSASEQQRLLDAFVGAAQSGNLAALEELLAEDVVSYSDGGGVVRASRIPVLGRDHVSKYITAFASRFWEGVSVAPVLANGQASVRLSRDGIDFAVVSITASAEGIDQVLWMMNPGKLGRMTAPIA
ncbi:RNA polymerase sigma-70 factor [Glaciibacter superstes]|uniref:RNA polymerase sigma-70 factor n=1 Tax=Glaciibacter superstes TaxID=501023 RepID=UPI0003B4883F|nr:RNA polymerase sigma-70 factor [Glaciibacter superstes]